MNVCLPVGGIPQSSWLATFLTENGVMVALGVGMVAFFRIRRWL
jgi:Mg2+ and Co2+ transporter CorA